MTEKTTRAKRHERTRQAILKAANEILAERGVEGLSIREIANRIEYSPSGLYEFFSSKDEIFNALCMDGFEQLNSRLKLQVIGDAPADRLVQGGMVYLQFAMQHAELYMLMFSTTPHIRVTLEQLHHNSAYSTLKEGIQDGIDKHVFQVRDHYGVEEMTYHFWAALHGIAMLRLTLFKHGEQPLDDFNRRIIEEAVAQLCFA